MPLEMRTECERCQTPTPPHGAACICSYECTFCPTCTYALKSVCPNCGGELQPRPRRTAPAP